MCNVFVDRYGDKYALIERTDYCVYFISDGEYIKIGVASSLPNRMKQLQTGNPRALKALFIIEAGNQRNALRIENELHEEFAYERTNGEWFRIKKWDIRSVCEKMGYELLKPVSMFDFEVAGITVVEEDVVSSIDEENMIHLDDVAGLLQAWSPGVNMTKRQQSFCEKTKYRDAAILTLLSRTGIRISELVVLDVKDVNFKHSSIRIIRKGGNESIVYFGDKVSDALMEYMELERSNISEKADQEHADALFLSLKHGRLTTRAVQKIVKKYSGAVIN